MPRLTYLKRPIAQLTLVVLLGALLRYIDLAQVPAGLFHDEAWSDVKAMQLNSGEAAPEVYFNENNGMDALHVYAIAALFRLTGPLALGSRLVSSLAGCLLILVTYWLASELFFDDRHRHPLAIAAAFVIATLFWALTTSRSGWHTMSMALFSTMCLASLVRATRLKSRRWFIVAGILAGIDQYTYPSARFLLVGLIIVLIFDLWGQRARWRASLVDYTLLAVSALVVFAPLGLYFIQHLEGLVGRAQQTTSNVDLASNFVKTALGFSFAGDADNLHNLPLRPALDPILSIFFAAGIIVVIWRQRTQARILLAWLIVFSLPVALTGQVPLFRRWTGVLPIEAILIAIGAVGCVSFINNHWRSIPKRITPLTIGGALGISALLSAVTYFGPYASNPQLFWAYDSGILQVANYIRSQHDSTIFLTPYDRFYEAIDVTLAEAAHAPIQSYNGTACTLLPAVTDRSTQWVVIVEHDNQTLPAIRRLFPNSQVVWRIDSPVGPYARALEVPAGQSAQLPVQNQVSADFGGDIQLIGYSELDKVKPGQTLDLTLAFRDVEPLDRLYKFFIHVAGADGSILAQDDRYPCDYTLNQADWRPGNILLQNFEVAIPIDTTAGSYAIKLGVYDPNSGSRLLVGQSALDHGLDQVNLGTIALK